MRTVEDVKKQLVEERDTRRRENHAWPHYTTDAEFLMDKMADVVHRLEALEGGDGEKDRGQDEAGKKDHLPKASHGKANAGGK